MSKYTLGTWDVSWSDHDNNGPIYFLEQVTQKTTDKEHDANARIMAAAPAMRHALTVALETLENEYPECVQDDYPAFKLIRDAIALADDEV